MTQTQKAQELDLLKLLEEHFKADNLQIQTGSLPAIQATPHLLRDIIKTILEVDKKAALSAITGLDLGENLGAYYHMRLSKGYFTVKIDVSKTNPKVQTITDILPGARFAELEATDLLGVTFEGNKLNGHFLLSENWPEAIYPLRKDVKVEEVKLIPTPTKEETEDPNVFKITIGPQHPALIEPEKLTVTVAGEIVTDVDPRIGYVHRGIEKATESRSYLKDTYLVERVCGICNSSHARTFVAAVEKILGVEVPPRAKYVRTVALELNRLHSHLLTLGHACLEMGYDTLFQYLWRDREPIMDLIELTSGNRVYSSLMTIGGVRRDLNPDDFPRIKATLEELRTKVPSYRDTYRNNKSIRLRMQDVGILTREDALKLCCVGPVARASGLEIDVRKDTPYEAYGEIPFNEIVYHEGDTWARMNVRLDEVEESINIIEYALDHMPTGPVKATVPRVVQPGEATAAIEAPRGELFYFVRSCGGQNPDRVKVRTPTYANLPSFLKTAIGQNLADCPVNFVSLDPCFSCTDR